MSEKSEVDLLNDEFEAICQKYWIDGKWGFYHADMNGSNIPSEVYEASDKYMNAVHKFYKARDGEKGFLGKFGL